MGRMGYERMLAGWGLGGFATQIMILAITLLLFFAAISLCVLAFRAVGAARRLRQEVDAQFRSVQDLAVEVRHLTAQVENAVARRASVPEAPPSRTARVGASETTPEADIEIVQEEPERSAADKAEDEKAEPADDADPMSTRMLDAARRAATEPAAILRSFMHRKK